MIAQNINNYSIYVRFWNNSNVQLIDSAIFVYKRNFVFTTLILFLLKKMITHIENFKQSIIFKYVRISE